MKIKRMTKQSVENYHIDSCLQTLASLRKEAVGCFLEAKYADSVGFYR